MRVRLSVCGAFLSLRGFSGGGGFAAAPQMCLRRRFCIVPCRGGRPCPPACPDSPDCLFCSDIATVAPRAHFFCLARKSGQKEALDTDRIVPQATEEPRRRTLRPAHDKLSANLHYSAACAGTTLPSGAVATQGDGKTRCCGNNKPPTYAPVVDNICVLL